MSLDRSRESSRESSDDSFDDGYYTVDGEMKGGSFTDQFLALMERLFRQIKQRKMDFFLELLIPLLFLAITLIMWLVWAPFSGQPRQFISYDAQLMSQLPNLQTRYACSNASMGNTIPTLPSCDLLVAAGANVSCDGDESSLPLKGLCYPSLDIDFSSIKVNGFSIGEIEGPMIPVQGWLSVFDGNPFVTPDLDEIIVFQWLARKQTGRGAVSNIIAAGLLPNSKQTAILCSGDIYFVGPGVEGLMNHFNKSSQLFPYVNGGTFPTLAAAQDKVRASRYNWAIIEVRSMTRDNFDVQIHLNSTSMPDTATITDLFYGGGYYAERADLYAVSGFLTMQKLVSEYYVGEILNEGNYTGVTYQHYYAAMGYIGYTTQPLLASAGLLLPFIFVLAFLYPVSQLTKQIVLEKELRIREAMLIMGMSNTPIYISWYVRFLLPNLAVIFLFCVIMRISYLTITDVLVVFLFFFLYMITCVPLAGFFSAFLGKARLASLLTPLIYFVFATPAFAITSANSTIITVFCIFPPTAFAVILLNLVQHEQAGGFGATSWNDPADTPPMYLAVVMLCVDFVFFNLLMLYLDAVLPKDWGTPKHPLFFIIDPFKACCGKPANYEGGPDGRALNGVFEDEDEMEDHAVEMCGLRKEYKRNGKKFTAVNNLYWGMREGEISVLLGHNGAGKTTVLNMMTGMIEPDEGDCYVYGLSVRRELSRVRQQVGFCPQHNILWPELTCRQHLEFFGKIKGLKGWELEDAVCRMLHETDLMEKIEDPSKSLSGGQKRKLSVAIAFVATSRLVFLDEPTAGMDVGARRYTWELLRRMSESHTIMLTTHYMDEADLLGHRIGIMSLGRLKCSGSSMFLKSQLGTGYSITLSLDPSADTDVITDLVYDNVEDSEELGINGCEAMYRLPNDSVEQFPDLLNILDDQMEELGVRGYSLSATTLEEIFLSVSEEDFLERQSNDPIMSASADVVAMQEDLVWNCDIVETEKAMWGSQFKAMMVKRLWNGLRDRKMQCFQVVTPVICILVAMLLSLISLGSDPEMNFDSEMFLNGCMMDVSQCDNVLYKDPEMGGCVANHLSFASTLNVSMYEVDTFLYHSVPRYGGISCYDPFFDAMVGQQHSVIHLVNVTTYHQAPFSLNNFYSGLYTKFTGVKKVLSMSRNVMPRTKYEAGAEDAIKTILMGAIIMIPFTFLPSNPVAWVVKERECKARHLQNVSGLRFYVYWLTNFLFDIAAYVLTMILVILIFLMFSRKEYVGKDAIGGIFTLFIVYGLSSTTTGYLCSFMFNEHSTAQTVTMAVSFVTGFLLVMIIYIFSLLENTQEAAKIMRWIARIIPSFCIGEGIINLAMLEQQKAVDETLGVWSMSTIGWPCVYMAIEFPVFAILTLVIDHPRRRMWGQRGKYDRNAEPQVITDEDSDVEMERGEVYAEEDRGVNEDMVRVVDLRKVYGNGKEAVRNITFRVVPGEVFGFLGTNGAGKTTTISMLCQEFIPTSGSASICGYDVVEDSSMALQCIGYCPQFDATLDLLTVEEHLRLYAGVRGIVNEQRDDVVAALLRMCELSEYRTTLSSQLSGGNRRKLSFAMSLVGGPRVVFLDEPSAGMDPVARRGLWNAIEKVADNSSVVLTTHHLEEVEALAHRVAIMVDGSMRCIGDKTHLKTKYGTGFEMSLRVSSEEYCRRLERWVGKYFPEASLNEMKGNRFVYTLPANVPLSIVFKLIQESKRKLHIIDYSVSQTSIEQVFLYISGELEEADQYAAKYNDDYSSVGSYASLASRKGDGSSSYGGKSSGSKASSAKSKKASSGNKKASSGNKKASSGNKAKR